MEQYKIITEKDVLKYLYEMDIEDDDIDNIFELDEEINNYEK